MEIKGKVHCFFEQSGTFKNEFKKLGYKAIDYDILNDFNETDVVIDLFKEDIEKESIIVYKEQEDNKIIDYDVLVGKTIPVMIDSWQPKTGFIVSYKKYLKTILPYKIDEELSVGMAIDAEVTGVRKNNVFLQFPDSNGDMIYAERIRKAIESIKLDKSASQLSVVSNL